MQIFLQAAPDTQIRQLGSTERGNLGRSSKIKIGGKKVARHVIDPYFHLNINSDFYSDSDSDSDSELDSDPDLDLDSHRDSPKTVGGKFLRK